MCVILLQDCNTLDYLVMKTSEDTTPVLNINLIKMDIFRTPSYSLSSQFTSIERFENHVFIYLFLYLFSPCSFYYHWSNSSSHAKCEDNSDNFSSINTANPDYSLILFVIYWYHCSSLWSFVLLYFILLQFLFPDRIFW